MVTLHYPSLYAQNKPPYRFYCSAIFYTIFISMRLHEMSLINVMLDFIVWSQKSE